VRPGAFFLARAFSETDGAALVSVVLTSGMGLSPILDSMSYGTDSGVLAMGRGVRALPEPAWFGCKKPLFLVKIVSFAPLGLVLQAA